jgi:hypothetical protein
MRKDTATRNIHDATAARKPPGDVRRKNRRTLLFILETDMNVAINRRFSQESFQTKAGNAGIRSGVINMCDGTRAAEDHPSINIVFNKNIPTNNSHIIKQESAMILVRNVFQLKFGKAKEAKALAKENEALLKKHGGAASVRFLTDVTGEYYTFVMETTHENLADFEKSSTGVMGAKEFGEWYQKFTPLVESGRREIFSIVS